MKPMKQTPVRLGEPVKQLPTAAHKPERCSSVRGPRRPVAANERECRLAPRLEVGGSALDFYRNFYRNFYRTG